MFICFTTGLDPSTYRDAKLARNQDGPHLYFAPLAEQTTKLKSLVIADFIDASFFREIEKIGWVEQLYRR